MNGRTTAIGLAVLLSVSVFAGVGLANTQEQPTVSAGSDQVSAGSAASVGIELDEAPDGLQEYQVTIELENPRVANITGAQPGQIRGEGFSVVSQTSSSITLRGADFGNRVGPGDRRVDLGTVFMNDTYGGDSEISVTVDGFRDDNSNGTSPTASSGELIVSGGTPRPTATATATPTPEPTTTTPAPTTTTPAPTTTDDSATPTDTTVAPETGSNDDGSAPSGNTIPPADGSDGSNDDGGDGSDDTPTATDTSSSGGPGFTAGLALLAVAGLALLARRRA
ncbi:PGF-CTERM sorting domain-containing protein [Halorientalis marina]|uniref:PGF-CTERM sorting domain-containing protein n=1 Tax=Halorientalis marina TaxID=2931976 RepID=UPI001FF1C278|nr:PGF-CTERM sorting domain-containing protein [Halorientalis marina]